MTIICDKGNPIFLGNNDLVNLIFKDQRRKIIVSLSILQQDIAMLAGDISVVKFKGVLTCLISTGYIVGTAQNIMRVFLTLGKEDLTCLFWLGKWELRFWSIESPRTHSHLEVIPLTS